MSADMDCIVDQVMALHALAVLDVDKLLLTKAITFYRNSWNTERSNNQVGKHLAILVAFRDFQAQSLILKTDQIRASTPLPQSEDAE